MQILIIHLLHQRDNAVNVPICLFVCLLAGFLKIYDKIQSKKELISSVKICQKEKKKCGYHIILSYSLPCGWKVG